MPLHPGANELQRIYEARFSEKTGYRDDVWKILAPFFSKWLRGDGTILDLGAGYCEFINNVPAGVKYAMDLNPDTRRRARADITVLQQNCVEPWPLPDGELDAVFTSNFLEHLPDKTAVRSVLSNAYRCLKSGGCFLAMGPNIRYLAGEYWDFFDHFVPLSELSLSEALLHCGFQVDTQIARFLPYTMSRSRQYPLWTLRLYLSLPAAWRFFGKQFLVVARKP